MAASEGVTMCSCSLSRGATTSYPHCSAMYVLSSRSGFLCMPLQLRSIDRLVEKLQSTAEEAKLPSTVCLHAGDLINRIESLKKERAELCFST